MDAMRKPDGMWREHYVKALSGQSMKIYINRDRNPKQIREDILGRRLSRIVASHLKAAGDPTIPYYKKRDKTVYIG